MTALKKEQHLEEDWAWHLKAKRKSTAELFQIEQNESNQEHRGKAVWADGVGGII